MIQDTTDTAVLKDQRDRLIKRCKALIWVLENEETEMARDETIKSTRNLINWIESQAETTQ